MTHFGAKKWLPYDPIMQPRHQKEYKNGRKQIPRHCEEESMRSTQTIYFNPNRDRRSQFCNREHGQQKDSPLMRDTGKPFNWIQKASHRLKKMK